MRNGLNTSIRHFGKSIDDATAATSHIRFTSSSLDKYFKWYNCSFRRLVLGILLDFLFFSNSKNILHTVADYFIVVSLRLYSNAKTKSCASHDDGEHGTLNEIYTGIYIQYAHSNIFYWHFILNSFHIKQIERNRKDFCSLKSML